MRSKKWLLGFFVTVIFLSYTLNAVYAADWPKRPLTVNVHANAGGGTDMIIRLVMSFVESEIGQKIIIVNKPGAGGRSVFLLYLDHLLMGILGLAHTLRGCRVFRLCARLNTS